MRVARKRRRRRRRRKRFGEVERGAREEKERRE